LEYAAQWETDKPYPLIRQGHEARAWQALSRFLAAKRRDWHLLELVEMREGSTGLLRLPRLFRPPAYWLRIKRDFNTPLVALDGPWENRWRTHPKMRKKLARMEKTFGDRLRFQVYRSPDDLDFCLDAYVALESKGWKSGRVGIGRDARTLFFYRDFLARLAARDCLRVGLLFIDATPVAAEIAYIEGRYVFFAHGTYDEQLARFSPGMVSTTLFLRHFHAGGYLEGDYLAGFTGYLSPWADRILPSYHVKIARICLPVLVLLALKAVRRLSRSASRVEVEDGWMPSSWRQPD
jgi:CelD/BcsL family acetyltransferase involved in cellulose biosynthesis